jgi:hypothetical protein
MLTMMNYDPVSLRILDELANTSNSLRTKDLMALCRLTRKQTFTRISILRKGYIISRNRQNYCYSLTSYGRLIYQKLTELNNLLSNRHRYRDIDIMKTDKNISSNELRRLEQALLLLFDNKNKDITITNATDTGTNQTTTIPRAGIKFTK